MAQGSTLKNFETFFKKGIEKKFLRVYIKDGLRKKLGALPTNYLKMFT